MAGKADRFYFENFVQAADCACKAANYLVECLENYDSARLQNMLKTMHEYEHAGDEKKHEMAAALAKAFVTPIDREDLALISQCIDDVPDAIEEVLQGFYMYGIPSATPESLTFAKMLVRCCELMKEMLTELINFKKPQRLHAAVVALNQLEEECDALYLEANKNLSAHCENVLEIISWRDLYNKMENCADSCEHVSDCVETVVMKNT